jgi:hypothetical protein
MTALALRSLLPLVLCVALGEDQRDSQATDSARAAPGADDLTRRAEAVKPTADELKWKQIPWALNLAEGQRLARAEGRPIFLWATGDDPLERC